jgi:hypothetical protein
MGLGQITCGSLKKTDMQELTKLHYAAHRGRRETSLPFSEIVLRDSHLLESPEG